MPANRNQSGVGRPVPGGGQTAAEWDVIGYADKFSISPSDTLRVMVSSESPLYSATIYRLGGAEPRRVAIPGEGTYPGKVQRTQIGSYVSIDPKDKLDQLDGLSIHLWIWPTKPRAGRTQGLVTRWQLGYGWGLFVGDDGRLAFKLSSNTQHIEIKSPAELRPREWHEILASVSLSSKTARLVQRRHKRWDRADDRTEVAQPIDLDVLPAIRVPLLIGAEELDVPAPDGFESGLFDGKIDEVTILGDGAESAGFDIRNARTTGSFHEKLVGAWDFAVGIETTAIHDLSPNRLDGVAVNMPTRGMTGHRWDATSQSPAAAPEQYSAIHFHSDDVADAGWKTGVELQIPAQLASGAYVVRLSGEANAPYEIPFFVTPQADSANEIVVLMPTFTYLAYGNDHLWTRNDVEHGILWPVERFENPDPADLFLATHDELGLALYDHHSDGSGCCYASRLRPLVNMQPAYRYWQSDGPRHYSADLLLLQWLERHGFRYDVITDEELHHLGLASIQKYKVLLTGSHPEYHSLNMLRGLESYLDGGGRMMYLGGNGFYWVTSVDPFRPHVIEVRRGVAGSRNWTSEPGESHHSTTGELGGLWRHRGKRPNELVGVGFSAMGYIGASGYERLPASWRSDVAFIFEGIGDKEVIGDFGPVLGGAAGDEVDRHDPLLGSPFNSLRLASTNTLNGSYQLCVEDVMETVPNQDGSHSDRVRSDLVYMTGGNGGAVFSVGSINWIATLDFNQDRNNVSGVTENVLRHFLRGRRHGR